MITRAQKLRDIASECRSIAEFANRAEIRRQLLEIAEELELLALRHENFRKRRAPSSERVREPGHIEEIPTPIHKSLKDLHAYWLARRGSSIGPPRSAIRPEELTRLLPNLALADVVGNPPRFRFRLFGTNLAQAYGENLTDKFLEEIDMGSASLKAEVIDFCTRLVCERRPQMVRVRFTKRDGRELEYERIGLPLSEDGRTVTMILCAFAFEQEFLNAVT